LKGRSADQRGRLVVFGEGRRREHHDRGRNGIAEDALLRGTSEKDLGQKKDPEKGGAGRGGGGRTAARRRSPSRLDVDETA